MFILYGVYLQENFSYEMHFKHIITVSRQRLHILKTLKRQGLRLELLRCVFHAVVAAFPNPRSDTPLSFSWFVCVLALSPVRTLAVTSARMLAVPLVRIAG